MILVASSLTLHVIYVALLIGGVVTAYNRSASVRQLTRAIRLIGAAIVVKAVGLVIYLAQLPGEWAQALVAAALIGFNVATVTLMIRRRERRIDQSQAEAEKIVRDFTPGGDL